MNPGYLQQSRLQALVKAAILTALIALVDWRIDLNISFGFLYMFPMLLVGSALSRWQVVLGALLCTFLSDLFDPFPFVLPVSLPQDILVFTALAGTGLFANEVARSHRAEEEHLRRVENESARRREVEEQLQFLIESSPAAILTMSAQGEILTANPAAHRLFDVEPGRLHGATINRYVPALGRVPSLDRTLQTFRTEMQCHGERATGDVFLANVFFSTYKTPSGPRLAALIVDVSEELRDREETSLEQLLAGSRILVAAVSHEVRNVCGAIAVIYENLVRGGKLSANRDFEALGSLVQTLTRIASLELRQNTSGPGAGGIELREVLDDLRIVLEPSCQEADIAVSWSVPAELPAVWADRHSLLQVLLNLVKNSQRALERAEVKRIEIAVEAAAGRVNIQVKDTGPGIPNSAALFQPLQKGAEATGLGLFLSRAFMRSFRGDLRHDPAGPGCTFIIELAAAVETGAPGDAGEPHQHATDPTLIAG